MPQIRRFISEENLRICGHFICNLNHSLIIFEVEIPFTEFNRRK
jgi:hypothetical protein